MKNLILCLLLFLPCYLFAQFGIKAGLNFANVTKASSINNSSRTGYHVGILLASSTKSVISSRTEFIFSRQGYNYKSGTNTGAVDLNYIILPQYMAINITKYFQLQFGGQMAFLLNAKVDSSNGNGNTTTAGPEGKIMNYYNRFDYGYGGGIEIHPFKGLLIGARVNISLGKLNKDPMSLATGGTTPASFIPKVDVKNNVFQFFLGYKFGK
jgi:hypothetical protein